MPGRSLDRAIDGLARRQHGAFHRRQAVRIGFTRSMIRRREGAGRWVRLAGSEVFALPSHLHGWLRQAMAATLALPDGALSGPAAAALLGFPGWPRARIEACTRRQTTYRSPFGDVRTTSTVGRVMVVEGIRVVSPADCIVQLAAQLSPTEVNDLVDDVRRLRRHLLEELGDRYAALAHSRLPGLAGVRFALEEHGDGAAPSESELERRLRGVLASVPDLPSVDWQATPAWLVRGAGRVDGLIPAWRLVVEADGRDWHTRVRDFERDRERDAVALAFGHATLRLTWHQLVRRRAWARRVIAAIGADRGGSRGSARAA